MEYQIRRSDTIAYVNKMMDNNWRAGKKDNTQAAGRIAVTGNRSGKKDSQVTGRQRPSFADTLQTTENKTVAKRKEASAATRQETPAAQERTHTLKAGETVWGLAVKVYKVNPQEILKLNNITDPRSLQIGQTLRIPEARKPAGKEEVVASWYGSQYHGKTMANGDRFNMHAATIAHKELPFGTKVLLENPDTGQKVTATVTDRGPFIEGRDVDLSYKLAQALSLDKRGVGNLTMEVL
ncbi:MAG: septal ring lytic transglycosylase RlpA family protein [Desulforhopalus sp.]|nr:septal ring lytic transglycosylase RlpA family protein [Desulforhopalus sp.]